MASITTKTTGPFDWANFDRATLKVGDEITDVLTTGETVTFVVVDEDVMGLKNCLADEHKMNNRLTNVGGWANTEMRRYLNEEIFKTLPEALQAIIIPRDFGKTQDRLWLFSETEIFGETIFSEPCESDRHFKYFQTRDNRIKLDCDGDPCWWWERSPRAGASTIFCLVNSGGGASSSYGDASRSFGVCFGFYF